MKIWTLTSSYVQNLYTWTCYCEANPAVLINSEEYSDLWMRITEDLWNDFGFHWEPDWEEEYDDWHRMDDDEQWEIIQEFAEDWKNNVSFDAYEVDEPENFDVLIDERL